MVKLMEINDIDEQERKMRMNKPYDQIDMQYLQTEPAYGKEAEPDFYKRLEAISRRSKPKLNPDGTQATDENGNPIRVIEVDQLWSELGFYTRDLRMGNLSELTGETAYCEHYINLAGDLLNFGTPRSFTTALRYAVTKLEISQSKKGFFRNIQGTQTRKVYNYEEGKSKNLLGGDRENDK